METRMWPQILNLKIRKSKHDLSILVDRDMIKFRYAY